MGAALPRGRGVVVCRLATDRPRHGREGGHPCDGSARYTFSRKPRASRRCFRRLLGMRFSSVERWVAPTPPHPEEVAERDRLEGRGDSSLLPSHPPKRGPNVRSPLSRGQLGPCFRRGDTKGRAPRAPVKTGAHDFPGPVEVVGAGLRRHTAAPVSPAHPARASSRASPRGTRGGGDHAASVAPSGSRGPARRPARSDARP
jgi:hypothetical protein